MTLSRKPSGTLVLALLVFASAVTSLLGPGAAGTMRSMVHWAFAPMGDGGMYLTSRFKNFVKPEKTISGDEAKKLQAENEILRRRLSSLENFVGEMFRRQDKGRRVYSKLFGQHRDTPVRFIDARVVSADSMPYGWTRLLNTGMKSGASKGMYVTQRRLVHDRSKKLPENLAVLSGTALAGRLTETGAFTARLQLVTDRGFEIRSQIFRVIDRSNPRTVQVNARMQKLTPRINAPVPVFAKGNGADRLIVEQVRKIHNIRPGDILQTSTDDGAMPVSIEIGRVVKVYDDPKFAGLVGLEVEPTVDLPSLREVYIVIPGLGRLGTGGRN